MIAACRWRQLFELAPPETLFTLAEEQLPCVEGLPGEALREALRRARAFDLASELGRLDTLGARVICDGDADYPPLLGEVQDRPLVLYWRGLLDPGYDGFAVVGSRRPTEYGKRMATKLARGLAEAGITIISGLARGIDRDSHEAALAAGAKTWAVLGSGLGQIYPPEHHDLAERIVRGGGALISEYSLDCGPQPWRFPKRNRIVSGLARATLVVEGRRESGSLITARLAIEQGRELLAVPCPGDSPLSYAPNELLREGVAKLVDSMDDIRRWFPGFAPSLREETGAVPSSRRPRLSLEYQKVLQLLGSDARTLDELSLAAGIDAPRLSALLFEMELQDLVGSIPGQRYAKKGRQA
mgnify:CR=1 FL=1